MAKVSPEFSMILPCPSDLGTHGWGWQLPAEAAQHQHQERGSRAASASCVRAAALPSAFGGLQGNVTGLKSVLLLWSGRAGARAALLLSGRSAAGTEAPGEMGLALHSCSLIHAVWGELLTMLSQPPVMRDLAELVFLGGQGSLRTKA